MATALQIAKDVVARSKSIDGIPLTDYVRGGMSYCQQFAGNFWEQVMGRVTPNSYNSAKNAMLASGELNLDYNAAPPGAYHYFDYAQYGHVGVALGSGLMASGTGYATGAIAHLGKHVYIHRVADYAKHLKYRGWAMSNGARPSLIGLVTDENAPQMAGNQRRVKPNADANLRVEPSTNSTRTVVKANTIVTGKGFVTSQLSGGQPSGSDKWVAVDGGYLHVSVFTDSGLHDLADLGIIAPPKPVVFHTVTVKYLNETDDVRTITVEDGKTVTEPRAPERDNFLFNGWGVDGVPFDFSTPITADVALEALWSAKPAPDVPVEPDPTPEPLPDHEGEPQPATPGKGCLPVALVAAAIVVTPAVIWVAQLAGVFQ